MRVAVGALVVTIVLMFASASIAVPRNEGNGDRAFSGGGVRSAMTSDMMSMVSDLSDGSQQLILVDSRTRRLCVYHVLRGTGQISLKSVRNVDADLQMDEFNNGGGPSPQEIRSLIDRR